MPLTPHPVAVLDVETTGFSKSDRIIEVGIVTFDDNGNEESRFESLIQPDRAIHNSFVHHITPAMVARAPHFDEVASRVAELINGRVIVAHNASFDARMLNQEFARLGHPLPPAAAWVIDTMRLSKLLLPGSPSKLSDALALSGIRNEAAHNALADAVATASLFYELVDRGAPVAAEPLEVDRALLQLEGAAVLPRPVRTGQPETDAYQQLLISALDDGVLTDSELELLVSKASALGLTREEATRIHESMIKRMAITAWADGILTGEEESLIRRAAESLDVAATVVDKLLSSSRGLSQVALVPGGRISFTGELEMPRESWEQRVVALGYSVGGITKQSCALVAADPESRSGKAKKARDYGVPIISEPELAQLIGDHPVTQGEGADIYVDEPAENPDFTGIFPWFGEATNDLSVLVNSWVNRFSTLPLAEISPRLNTGHIPEGIDQSRVAIRRWFNRHPQPLAAAVIDLRDIAGLGAKSISDIVHAVMLSATDGVEETDQLSFPTNPFVTEDVLADEPAPVVPSDESRVFDWLALVNGGLSDVLSDAPDEILLAEQRLGDRATATRERLARDVAAKIATILDSDTRFGDIAASRVLTDTKTLEEVGETWGVTRERIRQLEKRVRAEIADALNLHSAALPHRVDRPVRKADFLAANPDLSIPVEPGFTLFDYLIAHSISIHLRDGWVESTTAHAELTEAATSKADSYGVVSWEDLDDVGPADTSDRADWVASLLPGSELRDGLLFTRTRSIGDRAAAVLSVAGKPMTAEELIESISHGNVAYLSNAMSSDERFHRIKQGTWALVEWGGAEYTTVVDFIAQRVDIDGSYPLDALLAEARETGIAEATVRTYCSNGEFAIEDGLVTRNSETVVAEANPEEHAAMYFRDGTWQHLITVNHDHLRGSGFSVPRSLAGLFELSLLEKKTFSSPLGEQVLAFGRTNATTGSIRRFLQELGSKLGDRVWVRFDQDGTFTIEPATDRQTSTGVAELLNYCATDDRGDDLATLNLALGLAPGAPRRRTVSRFNHRREEDIANLVRDL
ncbi:exonuclease domain-containing protein [Corynebacterium doosanense]|uniref:Exonuclease n=1 Tax=Corynebacterium doosanense CAU 212 = DSM 45436 TaxID=558173 RepID=A0A097ICV7_9CORY|nr:exonuclease domain-containing protein [Corynebacterium doosanense]AIT59971.1 exonuclease [Corynebacterium doosanense CAU 212 = DSM 45436]